MKLKISKRGWALYGVTVLAMLIGQFIYHNLVALFAAIFMFWIIRYPYMFYEPRYDFKSLLENPKYKVKGQWEK